MSFDAQVLTVVCLLPVLYILSWFIPTQCEHCRKWIFPGFSSYSSYCGGYSLHDKCIEAYFAEQERRQKVPVSEEEQPKSDLRPIPEFGRFVLDSSQLPVFLISTIGVIIYSQSLLWGLFWGAVIAMGSRALIMITLIRVYKMHPQVVKMEEPL